MNFIRPLPIIVAPLLLGTALIAVLSALICVLALVLIVAPILRCGLLLFVGAAIPVGIVIIVLGEDGRCAEQSQCNGKG